jgi:cyclic pyranopterin phosphate synthase
VSAGEILDRIRAIAELRPVTGPHGNGPARYYAFDGARGTVGVISPLSHDYCDTCNRVRLSADGRLKLCLFGDHFIDLRTPVRDGAGDDELIAIFRGSMYVKPERHHLEVGQTASAMRALSEIGG